MEDQGIRPRRTKIGPPVINLGQFTLNFTTKWRISFSVAGIAVLWWTSGSWFLSQFTQARGIVNLGYSRLMLVGLGAVVFLMLCIVLAQIIKRRWIAVCLSASASFGAMIALDHWAPKPKEVSPSASQNINQLGPKEMPSATAIAKEILRLGAFPKESAETAKVQTEDVLSISEKQASDAILLLWSAEPHTVHLVHGCSFGGTTYADQVTKLLATGMWKINGQGTVCPPDKEKSFTLSAPNDETKTVLLLQRLFKILGKDLHLTSGGVIAMSATLYLP